MNILAIDYGEEKVGIAFSQGQLAQALTTIATNQAIDKIINLCRELEVEQIVVGLPSGRLLTKVNQFTKLLKQKLKHIDVKLWDETLTSQEAKQILINSHVGRKRRKQKEHQVAAALLLQDWLESVRSSL